MRKIDYGKINWSAATTWEFCGSKENLKEIYTRYVREIGITFSIEEFGYRAPYRGLAFDRGDIVTYTKGNVRTYATVEIPVSKNGYLYIRMPDGHQVQVHPSSIKDELAIADVPEQLIALARAEAGKPVDFSKCPLKKPACTEA